MGVPKSPEKYSLASSDGSNGCPSTRTQACPLMPRPFLRTPNRSSASSPLQRRSQQSTTDRVKQEGVKNVYSAAAATSAVACSASAKCSALPLRKGGEGGRFNFVRKLHAARRPKRLSTKAVKGKRKNARKANSNFAFWSFRRFVVSPTVCRLSYVLKHYLSTGSEEYVI